MPVTVAIAYLRRSTKGKKSNGKERQEKSISQQRAEIKTLAKGKYKIIRWYIDEGISGWKRNGKRPQFDKMLADARQLRDFQAVLCDDLDRFSRAEVMEVFADLSSLAAAGIKTIHCVNQGEYGLGESDIGRIIKMVVDVHGGNEFSRKLSRRIALSHRNRAKEAKRAGNAPYGMENDGEGGLKHGDPAKLKIVRRIFDRFAVQKQSLNSIAADLNKEGIPSPRGGVWYVEAVKDLLQRAAYRGDFEFGRRQQGRFFTIAKDGEVVESSKRTEPSWKTGAPAFASEGVYEPVVPPDLFDVAKDRLESFAIKGSRRPRTEGYPLSRILICDHCGKPMYGCQPTGRDYRVYRCSTPAKSGVGTCGQYEIRETIILPFVLRTLGEEIEDVAKLLTAPPDHLRRPGSARFDQRKALERDRDELAAKIDKAEENLLAVADARTRASLDKRISVMRDKLDELNAELATVEEGSEDYSREELQALVDWWDEFDKRAVSLPVTGKQPVLAPFYQDPFADEPAMLVDGRVVNEALHAVGAEVRLRWNTETVQLRNGKQRARHQLAAGRFRLGQQSGKLPQTVILRQAKAAGCCSCTCAAGRCDSRKGTG